MVETSFSPAKLSCSCFVLKGGLPQVGCPTHLQRTSWEGLPVDSSECQKNRTSHLKGEAVKHVPGPAKQDEGPVDFSIFDP